MQTLEHFEFSILVPAISVVPEAASVTTDVSERAIPKIQKEIYTESREQFTVSVPPAYITWGGLSVGVKKIKYFPKEEGKEFPFTIKFVGYNDAQAWNGGQARIRVDKKTFRKIIDKLEIKPNDT